nr:taste receptor type 2 member 134-like [Pogona vitticeps]
MSTCTAQYTFTAWLCVFYCVKIVNSTQSLFLWWKLRISRLIPRLIVGSLIFSLSAAILMFVNPKLKQAASHTSQHSTQQMSMVIS